MGKRPPLDERLSLYRATIAAEGITTGAGAATGDSFIDAGLVGVGANSFISMLAVIYPGQPRLVDSMDITGFNNATGEVTLSKAYKEVAAAIPAGVAYKIVTFRFVPAEVAAIDAKIGVAADTPDLPTLFGRNRTSEDGVYYDITNGVAGTVYPIGTSGRPVDNLTDALAIAIARGTKIIHVRSDENYPAIPDTMREYHFYGRHPHWDTIDLNDQLVNDSCFRDLNIWASNAVAHSINCYDCILEVAKLSGGTFRNCIFFENFEATSSIEAYKCFFRHCEMTISAGISWLYEASGQLTLLGMVAGRTVNIFGNGLDLTIDVSCTGGTVNVYGVVTVTNQTGGTTVNDYTIETAVGSSGLDTQIRRVLSGASGVIAAAGSKYIMIDSDTNGAEILSVLINGVVTGFDWTLDIYVPTADAVAALNAVDKRDKIVYVAADTEGGLLKPFGIAYNAFLNFTNDSGGNQTITEVVVIYRSRAAVTIGAWT